MAGETALELKDITFSYDKKHPIISSFSLKVEKGKFTTLLGSSGSGKTTLLRMISGFLKPDSGKVFINSKDVTDLEADRRSVGIVFQDYALFPHMSVKKNIAYGLRMKHGDDGKRLRAEEIKSLVEETGCSLGIEGLLDRFPYELSGGQQQRVALARSLVMKPELLLMDEPLSSLDAKLREKVREELKQIQTELGVTTVYVTHDQEEALSLSDRIAVLSEGSLLQYEDPRTIYFKPADRFTADFAGRANFVKINGSEYMVRPEWFCLNKSTEKGDVEGKITAESFLGDRTRFTVETEGGKKITADLPTLESLSLGTGRPVSLKIIHSWKMQ